MEHLNITFPEALKRELDREAKREHMKRSTFIQKAVEVYLKLKRRRAMAALLAEGYQEMAADSRKIAEEFSDLDRESFKVC